MSVQQPEGSLVWLPITYFTFSFAVFPSVLSTATTLLWPSHSSSRAQSMITRQDFQFAVCLFGILFPQITTESIFSPSVVCITFSVKCCLPIWNCILPSHACNSSFSSLLSFPPHSNATKHKQPNCCLLSSFSPQWNVNSTRQGFLVVLFSADSQHLGIYLKHDSFPINIEYFLNEWMNKWDHRGNKMMLRKEEWIIKAGRERPNVSVWSHLCKIFSFTL